MRVYEAHGHRALTHRGRDPLGRSTPHIAGCEHAREAGLQQEWISSGGAPALGVGCPGREPVAGQYEALPIQVDAAMQPQGVRVRADEEIQGIGLKRLLAAFGEVDLHRAEMPVALQAPQ
jgi:hypothetical protein